MKLASFHRLLSPGLFFLGTVTASYMLGAAVIYFDLPSAGILRNAFIGARAWNARPALATSFAPAELASLPGGIDKPDRTCDGFTLVAINSTSESSTRAYLLNMRRQLVHRWEAPFSRVWPNPTHLPEPVPDGNVGFFACHLYANGDLLVVYQSLDRLPVGLGLAKLDQDSNVLWKYPARVHHDIDIGKDGTIYALVEDTVEQLPSGLDQESGPFKVDSLVLLSPEGKELREPIPILEAVYAFP